VSPASGRDFKAAHNFTFGADIVKYVKPGDWRYTKARPCVCKIKYGGYVEALSFCVNRILLNLAIYRIFTPSERGVIV
jgi:hypothetical protein